jgi:alpha-amylase
MTPSEVADNLQPVSAISVPSPISWADEERDITAWLGNDLQNAAFEKLYFLAEKVNNCKYDLLKKDWIYLQSSDHFYYMCTKFFSDGAVHAYFNPYETPYDAFMNYMNVLSDFEIRINRMCPATDDQIEILKLDSQIKSKDEIIAKQDIEIGSLKKKLLKTKAKPKTLTKTKTVSLVDLATKISKKTAGAKTKLIAASSKKLETPKKTVSQKAKKTVAGKTTKKPKTTSPRRKAVK